MWGGGGAENADGLKTETAAYMGNSALEKLEQSCQLAHLLDRTTNVGLKYFWLGFIAVTSHSRNQMMLVSNRQAEPRER